MALIFDTHDPSGLLRDFKTAINDKKIVTWRYDSDGDFIHTPEQWSEVGWLRPRIMVGQLALGFIARPNVKCTKVGYAVYHGRFIESMLSHFDVKLTQARATALVTGSLGDNITAAAA